MTEHQFDPALHWCEKCGLTEEFLWRFPSLQCFDTDMRALERAWTLSLREAQSDHPPA